MPPAPNTAKSVFGTVVKLTRSLAESVAERTRSTAKGSRRPVRKNLLGSITGRSLLNKAKQAPSQRALSASRRWPKTGQSHAPPASSKIEKLKGLNQAYLAFG